MNGLLWTIGTAFLGAWARKQAPAQAGLVMAAINVIAPKLVTAHQDAAPDKPFVITYNHDPNSALSPTVTMQYQDPATPASGS